VDPHDFLSRLVSDRIWEVAFVLNDYVQFAFDGTANAGIPVGLSCYVWPVVEHSGHTWRESDLGYADALRKLTPGTVTSATEKVDIGIRIELDTGTLVIHPEPHDDCVEIAALTGFTDFPWIVWRPGEGSFEDLV